MKKVICKEIKCQNKDVVYYMPIQDEKVLCGGCKTWLNALEMSASEIAATFDYDLNAPRNIAIS